MHPPLITPPYASTFRGVRDGEVRQRGRSIVVRWANSVRHERQATRFDPVTGTLADEPYLVTYSRGQRGIAIARDGSRSEFVHDGFEGRDVTPDLGWTLYRGRQHLAYRTSPDGPPTVIEEVGYAESAAWSPDGKRIFAITDSGDAPAVVSLPERCLLRIDVATGSVTRLRCALVERVDLRIDPRGAFGALLLHRPEAQGLYDVELVDLGDGNIAATLRGTWLWPHADHDTGLLDERGRLIGSSESNMVVLDIASGRLRRFPLGAEAYLPLRLDAPRLETGEYVTLQIDSANVPALIAIDIDAALATAGDVPSPVVETKVDRDAPSPSQAGRFWTEPRPCPPGTTLRTIEVALGTQRSCHEPSGRRHGRYAVDRGERPIARGELVQGRRSGQWTAWSEEGRALYQIQFAGGKPGLDRRWFPSGGIHSIRSATGDALEHFYSTGVLAYRMERSKASTIETYWRGDRSVLREKTDTKTHTIDIDHLADGRRQVRILDDVARTVEMRTYRGDVLDGPAESATYTPGGSFKGSWIRMSIKPSCYVAGARADGACAPTHPAVSTR